MEVTVILPLYRIPEGERVTKRTGTKEYIVRDQLRIYGLDEEEDPDGVRYLNAGAGGRFLVDPENGNANVWESKRPVVWKTTVDELVAIQAREQLEEED
jgi:hypothetical protein